MIVNMVKMNVQLTEFLDVSLINTIKGKQLELTMNTSTVILTTLVDSGKDHTTLLITVYKLLINNIMLTLMVELLKLVLKAMKDYNYSWQTEKFNMNCSQNSITFHT